MKNSQFEKLIQEITGRNFILNDSAENIEPGKKYQVTRKLPITGRRVGFEWTAAKCEDKLLRSFVTAFCSKYKEPNPAGYNKEYGGKIYTWDEKTPEQKEYAYSHHVANMYSKDALMKQIEENFNNPAIENTILRHGFYPTEYGIGIFCLFCSNGVLNAIEKMKNYLQKASIPFSNEFSDARWVLRYKLNLSKDVHSNILNSFNQ